MAPWAGKAEERSNGPIDPFRPLVRISTMKRRPLLIALSLLPMLGALALGGMGSFFSQEVADLAPNDLSAPPQVTLSASPPASSGKDGAVRIGYLTSPRLKPTRCFADYFTTRVQKALRLATRPEFRKVPLAGDLRGYDLLVLSGEGPLALTEAERQTLRNYLQNGGFLLAAAGFGSAEWDRAFREEIGQVLAGQNLAVLPQDHPLRSFPFVLGTPATKKGQPAILEGLEVNGRWSVLYASAGLNDSAHVKDCCVCGGNEVENAWAVSANALAWALRQTPNSPTAATKR